jgi:hypothetical protein
MCVFYQTLSSSDYDGSYLLCSITILIDAIRITWLVSKKKNQLKKNFNFYLTNRNHLKIQFHETEVTLFGFSAVKLTQSVHPHVLFDEPPSGLSFLNCFQTLF